MIFQNSGAAGVLVITLDDSNPITLKFRHKIVATVILDQMHPASYSHITPVELLDAGCDENVERIVTATETSKTMSEVNDVSTETEDVLPCNTLDGANENDTTMFSFQHKRYKADNIKINGTADLSVVQKQDEEKSLTSDEQVVIVLENSEIEMLDCEDIEGEIVCPVTLASSDLCKEENVNGESKSIPPVSSQVKNKPSAEKQKLKTHCENAGKSVFGKRCEACKKMFNNKLAFSKHHVIVAKKIKCTKCGRICQSKAHLLLHERFAHGNLGNSFKMNPFKCPICLDLCKDMDMISHVRSAHISEELYKCCICQSQFQDYSSLKSHLKTHDLSTKQMTSTNGIHQMSGTSGQCLETVLSSLQHEETVDSRAAQLKEGVKLPKYCRWSTVWRKTWTCEYCERMFKSNGDYVGHMRPSEIVDICEECHFAGSSKAAILIHQYQKHVKGTDRDTWKHMFGKVYCHICGEICHPSHLLDHIMIKHTGEIPYKCCICGAPSQTRKLWLKHGKLHKKVSSPQSSITSDLAKKLSTHDEHDNDKPFCKLCKQYFDCEKDFIRHLKNETDQIVCDICEIPSCTKAGSIVHKYISHGLTTGEDNALPSTDINGRLWEEDSPCCDEECKTVQCPCCPDDCSIKKLLFHVMESHTHESPFKCCCCKSLSSSMDQFFDHCDFHLGKKPYGAGMCLCRPCNLRFETRDLLKNHQKMHKKICLYCSQEFNTIFLLNIHLQNDHKQDMMSCEICGKMFSSLARFAEHKRHHYYKKQYQCPICGILVCKLDDHMVQHNPSDRKIWTCRVCGDQFQSTSAFKTHMEKHDPALHYSCDICNKTFRDKKQLARHAKTHLNHRQMYECVVCGKKCSQRGNLRIHMRIHKSEKAFKCKFCDQGFNYNQSLQIHMKAKHGQAQDKK